MKLNQLRVALLTNYLPPSHIPMLEIVAQALPCLRIFLSTQMGRERHWSPDWNDLPVTVQRNLSIKSNWRHPRFQETLTLYVPYDTFWQLQRFRPHVIVSTQLGVRTIFAALYRRLYRASRLVVWAPLSEQSELEASRNRKYVRSWLLPQADHILVNGTSCARYIRSFGVAESKMSFLPYTTDIRPFAAIPLTLSKLNPIRLLYVGQLTQRKGVTLFLNQLESWARTNPQRQVELTFAGDGPERKTLNAMPLPSNLIVRFLGNLDYADLPQAYAQSDLFVFPTLADEWGIVINEAMASGLPVLGSLYSQAVEELVQEGETGWLFRPDHPAEYAAALERALKITPERLFAMRQASRNTGLHLTPDFAANQMLAAIETAWHATQ